ITIAQASKKAFDELEGFNTSAITPMSFFGKGNIVDGRGPGCAPYCSAMSWYRSPGKGTALKAIYADQRPVYRFTSKEEALRLTRYDTDLFDKAQFLTNLSRHLPEWAYVYAAPVHKKSPPMILHQGQAHYF